LKEQKLTGKPMIDYEDDINVDADEKTNRDRNDNRETKN
jgi:hypothetical protein